MKATTFKALLTSIILLCSITSMYAQTQRNLYWRQDAVNNNFNNLNNWTDSPTGVGGMSPGTPPSLMDNVFFTNNSNIISITVPSGNTYNMRNLTASGGHGYRLTSNVAYNIAGSISLDGTFSIAFYGTVNLVENTSPVDITIDLGTSNAIEFGITFAINKPASKVNLINHDFKRIGSITQLNALEFNSNGFDIEASSLVTGNATSPRKIDLSGTTLTTTADATTAFSTDANSTFIFDDCNFVSNNDQVGFGGINGVEIEYSFKSMTFRHPTAATIISNNTGVNLIVENLTFKSPKTLFTMRGGFSSGFKTISVTNQLEIPDTCFVFINSDNISHATTLEVNKIAPAINSVCGASQRVIQANHPVTLKSIGAPITTQNLAYYNITFNGDWIAPESDNLGSNTGDITWTTVTGRNFYWVGGSGDWDNPAHWSIGEGNPALTNTEKCTPSVIDDVYIDENSFTAAGQTINLMASKGVKNIYWTDANRRGSLITQYDRISLSVNGDADFSGVATAGISSNLYFIGSGNHSITSATDITYRSNFIYFVGTGTYTLLNDFLSSSTANNNQYGSHIIHYSGGLVSNRKTIDIGRLESNSYPVTAKRTLDLSNSEIKLKFNSNNTYPLTYILTLDSTNLDSYDFAKSHFYLNSDGSSRNHIMLRAIGGRWEFNDVTFVDPNADLDFRFSVQTNGFHNITCNGNMNFNHGFTVDSLILSPEKTYTFANNQTVVIDEGMTTRSNGCNMATITSNGTARINATYSPFEITGANISRINASGGNPLTVNGGLDGGNNTNVTVDPFAPKTLYWVGGTGNWSDPTNWSIGVSGGDPAEYNSEGCIPGKLDDVIFDVNSFDAIGQTVTIDMMTININNMTWTSDVNLYEPILANNLNYRINISGSLEWAEKMTLTSGGAFYFTGAGSHFFKANNMMPTLTPLATSVGSYYFIGGGHYELIGNVNSASFFEVNRANTQFYSNGYNITSNYIRLYQGISDIIDITDSQLSGGVEHSIIVRDNTTFFSDNTRIVNNVSITNTGQPISFKSISLRTGSIVSTDSVTVESITLTGNSTINGKFITDTLSLAGVNATYTITAGTTLTANDTIIVHISQSGLRILPQEDRPRLLKQITVTLRFRSLIFLTS